MINSTLVSLIVEGLVSISILAQLIFVLRKKFDWVKPASLVTISLLLLSLSHTVVYGSNLYKLIWSFVNLGLIMVVFGVFNKLERG